MRTRVSKTTSRPFRDVGMLFEFGARLQMASHFLLTTLGNLNAGGANAIFRVAIICKQRKSNQNEKGKDPSNSKSTVFYTMPRKDTKEMEPSTPLKYTRKTVQTELPPKAPTFDTDDVPDDVRIWLAVFDNEPSLLAKPDAQMFQS